MMEMPPQQMMQQNPHAMQMHMQMPGLIQGWPAMQGNPQMPHVTYATFCSPVALSMCMHSWLAPC